MSQMRLISLITDIPSMSRQKDGFPANKTLSDEKLEWLEDVLASSDEFDYVFVAGHYQILDVRGYYDPLLKARVLPLLHKYKVNAYLQGHYHTLEHAQAYFRDFLYIQTHCQTSDM